jgi:protein-tyrosine-phosphatase
LFVCIGNACRSPMAEAIARYDAADVMEASSAGLSPLGFIPDLTQKILKNNGYSAADLASERISLEACESADIIINMTGEPRETAFERWGFSAYENVEDWMVEDPYSADEDTYQRVLEGIQRRVAQLAKGLRDNRENRTSSKQELR